MYIRIHRILRGVVRDPMLKSFVKRCAKNVVDFGASPHYVFQVCSVDQSSRVSLFFCVQIFKDLLEY